VEQGNELRTHADVPQHIRDQLYAEDQQRLRAHQRANSAPAASFPPINITNVLPGHPHLTPDGSSPSLSAVPDMSQAPLTITRLDIPGNRDEVVEEYCAWQEDQVKRDDQKEDYRKACHYLIENNIDLEEAYQDHNVACDLQEKAKVKRGAAWRVVGDVGHWAKRYKQDRTGNQVE
jgi:hypothetical protein